MSIKKGTMPPRYDDAFKSGAIKLQFCATAISTQLAFTG